MKMLVVDGNSILNRAYYGIKLLTAKNGQYTNGIYGFLTTLRKMLDETEPQAVAIAFDLKAPTFRHRQYDGYKANRKGMPAELASQLQPLKDLLSALGFAIVTCEGYEADDILGTLSASCEKNDWECVLATGDRDSLQLISPRVTVRLAVTKYGKPEVTVYDEAKIQAIYGVTPPQLIEIKALQGDTSDCIPGVPGIGEKGAGDLIRQFGSVDRLYEQLAEAPLRPIMKQKLEQGKEKAYLSRSLGTICREAPIDTDLSHYTPAPLQKGKAASMMASLELFSLMEKWDLHPEDVAASALPNQTPGVTLRIEPEVSLTDLCARFRGKVIDVLYTSEENRFASLTLRDGEAVFQINALTPGFMPFLESFWADEAICKRVYDAKTVYTLCAEERIACRGITSDLLLCAYLLNPNASDYGLLRLESEYGISPLPGDKGSGMEIFVPLLDLLEQMIEEKEQTSLLKDIELPLSRVLSAMEEVGFAVDREGIRAYGEGMKEEIDALQKSICQQIGANININSPKQLGTALFETMGLPKGKKTKSGYSTSAEVLEELRDVHPVIGEILEYRGLAKLRSTYCDGLLKVIGPDGRIHSCFNQTETRTGRISSAEPNLQNIPVKTARGRELRRFFRAKDGCLLVDADYSQIELRVLAHIANDKAMIEAFANGSDIHTSTAAKVFGLPEEMVTPALRSRAKAVNFGIVYGIGAFSLSKDIGVSRKEAETYIRDYLRLYEGIDRYMKEIVETAKNQGYVTTMFGRRRYLPELASSNHALRSFGERVARNMPIQGTAADIIKIAMIRVDRRLREEGLKARLILQVHDELIVEAPEEEAEAAARLLSEEMQQAVTLSVQLTAEAGIGKTWYDAKC